jgi:hypothetical protein
LISGKWEYFERIFLLKYLFFAFWKKIAPKKTPPDASSQVAISWLSILQFIYTRMALLR